MCKVVDLAEENTYIVIVRCEIQFKYSKFWVDRQNRGPIGKFHFNWLTNNNNISVWKSGFIAFLNAQRHSVYNISLWNFWGDIL